MRKREGGCPNRCRCVAPSQRRRWVAPPQPLRDGGRPNCCGTAVVPTAAERRLPQPLREGGCPNRYRCMAPLKRRRLGTVALPRPGRAGCINRYGCMAPSNRCRYIAVAQTPDHATQTNSFSSFSIGGAIDSPVKPKRRSAYTFIAFLTEIRHCPSSIQ